MGVPREMLIEESPRFLASVVEVREVPTAEVNSGGRKQAQILFGSEGGLEHGDVNFETVAMKVAAKRRKSRFNASDKR